MKKNTYFSRTLRSRRALVVLALMGSIAISWAAISHSLASTPSGKDSKGDLATVSVLNIQPAEISEQLTYPARVTAKINTRVLSEIDGVVAEIRKPLGDRVERGQVLLVMTHTDPVYQYAPVQVLAPVSGVVSSVEVTEGTQVLKGNPLLSVTDPSQIRVQIEVPSADLGLLRTRQTGELLISGRNGSTTVKVRGISPFVDPTTGTASAELNVVPGSKYLLAPGELGQVTFKTGIHTGYCVPDFAVVYRGSNTYLRLIESGKLRSVPVTLGKRQHGAIEVLTGLSPGAAVVQRASRFVADGDAVNVQSAGDASSSM